MDFDSRLADLEDCFRDLITEIRRARENAKEDAVVAQARLDECRRLIYGALQPRPAVEAPRQVPPAPQARVPELEDRTETTPPVKVKPTRVFPTVELQCQNGACQNTFTTTNKKRKFCKRCFAALSGQRIKERMWSGRSAS